MSHIGPENKMRPPTEDELFPGVRRAKRETLLLAEMLDPEARVERVVAILQRALDFAYDDGVADGISASPREMAVDVRR